MSLIGYLLGNRYEIIEKIGDGGMATVYKAKCRLLNRFVAIKILKEEFLNDSEISKRFSTEAQSAASLSHPNIVSIYDVGREGNFNYIVMELVEGQTLKDMIRKEGKFHWQKASQIAYQIAQGLEHAHKNHIIHRDIKPHNIIVTNDMKVKVADFGIAKAVTSSTITLSGDTIGSVHYFSPEQAKGGLVTEKSDIYSLGIVLYEMLTGKVPFDGDSPVTIALKHVQEKAIAPFDLEISVPYSVSSIVMKAIHKDITQRYQTATEFAFDLNLAMIDSSKNHVKFEDYTDLPTQKMKSITDDMLDQNKEEKQVEESSSEIPSEKTDKAKSKIRINKKMKRNLKYAILGIVGLIVFFGSFFIGLLVTGMIGRGTDVQVPDITHKTVEQATTELKKVGLNIIVDSEINDNEVAFGQIISQQPANPMKIKKGGDVKVVVSKGPTIVKVPNIKNMLIEDAQFKLSQMGLNYEERKEINLDVDQGVILRTTPEAESEVASGSVVVIYVSDGVGTGKVKLPNLVGKSIDDAMAIISDNNLTANVVYKADKNKDDKVVLSQSIPSGSIISESTVITLEVNKKPVVEEDVIKAGSISFESGKILINLEEVSTKASINIKVLDSSKNIIYDKTVSRSERILIIDANATNYVDVYINNASSLRLEI